MPRATHSLLRKRDKGKASVSYSELLFDLIYVFAVTQLSHYLLHHLTWLGMVQEMLLWFAVWMAWQHTAWVTNWFNPDTRTIRLLLFVLMGLGLIVAAAIPDAFTTRAHIFVFSYVATQVGRTLFVLFLLGNNHSVSNNYKRILVWVLVSSAFWIWGVYEADTTRLLLWGIAVICDYTSPLFRFYVPFMGGSDPGREWTIEGHHLAERCQLFVIIAFGETILMTGATLSEMDSWTQPIIGGAIISFVNSLAMWWVYFDVSSEAGSEKILKTDNPGWLGLKYHAIHVVLVGALILCAVGDELVVHDPFGKAGHEEIVVLVVGPVIYLMANMIYKWMIDHTVYISHIIAIIALCLLLPVSYKLDLIWVNALSVVVFIFVIVFDMCFRTKRTRKGSSFSLSEENN